MKNIITVCFFFIAVGNCFAQQITFQKIFGGTGDDEGTSVQQTTDGGYIITGWTNSFGAGDHDIYLIKTDINGDTLWTKTFGGINDDYGYSVQQINGGGYIITGYSWSFGTGNANVYLVKTDANGNSLWSKIILASTIGAGHSIHQTTDGGYIIAGNGGSNLGNADVYLIKTNSNGNLLWTKTFGGINIDNGWSVHQTMDGGYIITGWTDSFGAGGTDVDLIRTDTNGDTLWTKTFGGVGFDRGLSVHQTTDGGYIITGWTDSFGAGSVDVYLIKTDANGDLLWTKTFGGTGMDWGYSVRQTVDGGYIISGYTNSFGSGDNDVYLIKTDVNGDTLWTKTYGGINNDTGFSVQQATDGGYIIAGSTNNFGAGNTEVYLIKTDSIGNSGCNEGNTATIVTVASTQVTSSPTTISAVGIVNFPATLVGSGGTVITLCTTVGIQSAIPSSQFAITISPNPTSNNFTITFPNTFYTGAIEIYNVLGEKMIEENIMNTSKKEIHLKNISAGIYFVKVKEGEKEYAEKFVVE